MEWYTRKLSKDYEDYLSDTDFGECVLAYRSGQGNNITQAGELVSEVAGRGDALAMAMDIKSFFDNINHKTLLATLRKVLKVDRLKQTDFKIFQRMTKFESVDSEKLAERLQRNKPAKGRLCTSKEFRDIVRRSGDSLVAVNPNDFGIPQGTPLSGLYANISLLDFDKKISTFARSKGGSYRRYSDDLAFILPADQNEVDFIEHVTVALAEIGLKVSKKKTEISKFKRSGRGITADKSFQYLGFTYDGERTLIRQSSLNRYYSKMHTGIRAKIRAAKNSNIPRDQIYMRELYRRYTHWGKSRNFPRYAYRASETLGAPEIRRQLRNHVPRFNAALERYLDQIYT